MRTPGRNELLGWNLILIYTRGMNRCVVPEFFRTGFVAASSLSYRDRKKSSKNFRSFTRLSALNGCNAQNKWRSLLGIVQQSIISKTRIQS